MRYEKDTTEPEPNKYRYVEYERDVGTVAVIQDVDNDDAWIESTVASPVPE